MEPFQAVKFTKTTQSIIRHKAFVGAFVLGFAYETEEWANARSRARLGGHATQGER